MDDMFESYSYAPVVISQSYDITHEPTVETVGYVMG